MQITENYHQLQVSENLSAFLTGFNQALGHKHKNKTLEEILRTTPKQKAKLIGFDEDPLVIETYSSPITDEFAKLSIKEVKPDVKFKSTSENGDCCSSTFGSAVEGKAHSDLKNGLTGDRVAVVGRGELNGSSNIHINTGNLEGMLHSCALLYI